MCGICGVVRTDPGALDADLAPQAARMAAVLGHRGPDAQGSWAAPDVALCHRRLKIVDLSDAANQPMRAADDRLVLLLNGEIYDYRELRARHRLDDVHPFRTRSDTEVVLALYRRLGDGFLEALNGIFALALLDRERGRLVLARDPLGIKPLYLARGPRGLFAFASELKAFRELSPDVLPLDEDPEAWSRFLAFGYLPGRHTPWRQVEKLEPGVQVTLDLATGTTSERRFFHAPTAAPGHVSRDDAVARLREALDGAAARQGRSDVAMGLMLSAGVDSTILARLLARRADGDRPLHSFTLRFPERRFDEGPDARRLAAELGFVHHEIPVTPDAFANAFDDALWHLDEPSADTSAIPVLLLAREARQSVKVLFCGDGGDELFFGYDTYTAHRVRDLLLRMPAFVRERALPWLLDRVPPRMSRRSRLDLARLLLRGMDAHPAVSHVAWRAPFLADEQARWSLEPREDPFACVRAFHDGLAGLDRWERLRRIDLAFHFPHKIQLKTDRMLMACGIEGRVPWADLEVARLALGLPPSLLFRGGRKKALVRSAFAAELPARTARRGKTGLLVPSGQWFRGPLRDWLRARIMDAAPAWRDRFRPADVEALWRAYQDGIVDASLQLWTLANLAGWRERFLRTPRTP